MLKDIIGFIRGIVGKGENIVGPGAILPPQKEIDAMPTFREVVGMANPVIWDPLNVQKLPSWPQYDQHQTYQCVAHGKALSKTILFYKRNNLSRELKFSASWIYWFRQNRPASGMYGTDSYHIDKTVGDIPFDLLPTPQKDDDLTSGMIEPWMYDIAKVFQSNDEAILLPIKQIDVLASVMEATGKPISLYFEFNYDEWTAVPVIKSSSPQLRHCVTFVPPKNPGEKTYGMYNGEKAIVIQDSWGFANGTINGKRIITESFLKARNIFAAYEMRFKFDVTNNPVKYDGTIISLQKCLQSLGYFPTNVNFAESLGPVTKSAISKFQAANGIPVSGLFDDTTKALIIKNF